MLTDEVKILLPKVSVEALLLTLLFSISLTMRLSMLFELNHNVLTLHEADATGYFAGGFAAVLPVFAFSNFAAAPGYIFPIFPILITWLSIGLVGIENELLKVITGWMKFKGLERFRQWSLASTVIIVFLVTHLLCNFWKI